MQIDKYQRITVDPNIMAGKPTIRGLRITVEQILMALSNGISYQELIEDYPELEKEDISQFGSELPNHFCVYQRGVLRIKN